MGETASTRIKSALIEGCSVTNFLEHADHGASASPAAKCFPTYISFVLSTHSTFPRTESSNIGAGDEMGFFT